MLYVWCFKCTYILSKFGVILIYDLLILYWNFTILLVSYCYHWNVFNTQIIYYNTNQKNIIYIIGFHIYNMY